MKKQRTHRARDNVCHRNPCFVLAAGKVPGNYLFLIFVPENWDFLLFRGNGQQRTSRLVYRVNLAPIFIVADAL